MFSDPVFFSHFQGNPVCREVEYRFTVLAYIKNITYHDYATVDPAEVVQVGYINLPCRYNSMV